MADLEFSKKIIETINEKKDFYNNEALPKILEEYRFIHSCVKKLIENLIQRSLIKQDPYKLDKKISDIEVITNEPFLENERDLVIGIRLSDYESILDFICTYVKFSVDSMTFQRIKKIVDFNNTFNWTNFSVTNQSPNTRGLAALVAQAKNENSAFSASMLNELVSKWADSTKKINQELKLFSDFKKEAYKAEIRDEIFSHQKFNKEKADASVKDEISEIKKVFPLVIKNAPFYAALVEEIANEDLGSNKVQLQEALLKKLQIEKKEAPKKEKQINPKEFLMNAVQALGGLGVQLESILSKLKDNNLVLESRNKSFFEKMKKLFRKAFNIEEPEIFYTINITDSSTGAISKEKIDFKEFLEMIEKRILLYNSFSLKSEAGFQKIEKNPPEKILEFLNKEIAASQRIITQLNAFDEFFKTSATAEEKSKIKGLKMELTTLKNTIINTNQRRADYISLIEEQEQMKKLGITNE